MERYDDSYGYWRTLWWLVRRFTFSPVELFRERTLTLADALEAIKSVLIFLMLLLGPLMIVLTPLIALWPQYRKYKRAQEAKQGEQANGTE